MWYMAQQDEASAEWLLWPWQRHHCWSGEVGGAGGFYGASVRSRWYFTQRKSVQILEEGSNDLTLGYGWQSRLSVVLGRRNLPLPWLHASAVSPLSPSPGTPSHMIQHAWRWPFALLSMPEFMISAFNILSLDRKEDQIKISPERWLIEWQHRWLKLAVHVEWKSYTSYRNRPQKLKYGIGSHLAGLSGSCEALLAGLFVLLSLLEEGLRDLDRLEIKRIG